MYGSGRKRILKLRNNTNLGFVVAEYRQACMRARCRSEHSLIRATAIKTSCEQKKSRPQKLELRRTSVQQMIVRGVAKKRPRLTVSCAFVPLRHVHMTAIAMSSAACRVCCLAASCSVLLLAVHSVHPCYSLSLSVSTTCRRPLCAARALPLCAHCCARCHRRPRRALRRRPL